MPGVERRPELGDDARANTAALRNALAAGPGTVRLVNGRWPVTGGLVLTDDRVLAGTPGGDGQPASRLVLTDNGAEPLVHLLGSRTAVRDIALELPASRLGEHDGDMGTAVTVGRYLYAGPADWLQDCALERLVVARTRDYGSGYGLPANSIAVMGAVRNVRLDDVTVTGGGTGLAVHWGAVGSSVHDITGPSYHPNGLRVRGLVVRNAFEGFYLSSAHDVIVDGSQLYDVEIGFRLLAGDNTVRFAPQDQRAPIGSRIVINRTRISWNGHLYALRIAGWGRSEVDGTVSTLPWRDVVVRDCAVTTLPATVGDGRPRAGVVLEEARGVALEDIVLEGERVDAVRTDAAGRLRISMAIAPSGIPGDDGAASRTARDADRGAR